MSAVVSDATTVVESIETIVLADGVNGQRAVVERTPSTWVARCYGCDSVIGERSAHFAGSAIAMADDLLNHLEKDHGVRR